MEATNNILDRQLVKTDSAIEEFIENAHKYSKEDIEEVENRIAEFIERIEKKLEERKLTKTDNL